MAASSYEKIKFTFIVVILYICPIALMLVGLISFYYRFILLVLVTILVILYTRINQIKLEELGCTHQNLVPAVRDILPVTLGFALLMLVYYFLKGTRIDNSAIQWYFYLFFILVSTPFQEFLYRGYLFHLFSKVGFSEYFLVVSAILYSFVHVIYWDLPTLLFTLIIGLVWGYHYKNFQNLYSVIFSHSLLGVVAIATGLL
ncbi:abortive infection protein [Calothrix sp. NIES-2100]|uniref:CPBP family intramembrane glutamic endopeptidase n=1 Tax=Calothrix sp. NIES-2100 TaxID=1954172 RepID=UPI000B5E3F63|nr:abortive infection protein [Calothrix sp. NIES-2100]